MSSFIQTCENAAARVRTNAENYAKRLPNNIIRETAKGFLVGFVIGTIITSNPGLGALHGAAYGVATLIHSLITPLFNDIMHVKGKYLTGPQEWLRRGTAIIFTSCLFYPVFGAAAIADASIAFVCHGLAILCFDNRRRTDEAAWMMF